MSKYFFLVITLTSVILIHCAIEPKQVQSTYVVPQEKCELPVWDIGDYWVFQYNDKNWWSHKVVRVENDLYIIQNPNDKYAYGYDTKSLHLKVYIDSEGKKVIPQTESGLSYDFPLYVGRKWSKTLQGILTDNRKQDYLYTFQVMSFEKIIVRAGAFRAFKIECERNVIGSGNTAISHVWYSPEVKNMVKFQFVTTSGNKRIRARDYELATYKLASTGK